jgi:cobalt-zinc-cadmium efflux system protein
MTSERPSERAADHAPGTADRARRLQIALTLNLAIVVAQVVFGVVSGSLGLLADAAHNLTDVAAIGASLVAVRWSARRPTATRSFGYHRGTVLAAQANAAAILAVTLLLAVEAIRRLGDPGEVEGGIVFAVAAVSAMVNGLAVVVVHERGHAHGHSDINMRSAKLHLLSDALASLGVAAVGLVMLLTDGSEWLDPAVSLAIGALIAVQAIGLFREAADVLLESTPQNIDVADVAAAIEEVPGVDAVHDLHVWSLSSDVRALSAHLVLAGHPTLEEAQLVGGAVKAVIGPRYAIAHVTLELECEACLDVGPWCPIEE